MLGAAAVVGEDQDRMTRRKGTIFLLVLSVMASCFSSLLSRRTTFLLVLVCWYSSSFLVLVVLACVPVLVKWVLDDGTTRMICLPHNMSRVVLLIIVISSPPPVSYDTTISMITTPSEGETSREATVV